jgi:hypothetical protein
MISASAARTSPRLPPTIAAGRVAVCTAGIQLCYRLAGKASWVLARRTRALAEAIIDLSDVNMSIPQ